MNENKKQKLITMKKKKILPEDLTFFEKRAQELNWKGEFQKADGSIEKTIGAFKVESKFGKVENVLITDNEGNPLFDRPGYWEKDHVLVVAWGKDQDGKIRIAMITEERPHPENPQDKEDTNPLKFLQIPMGFIEKIIGKSSSKNQQELGSEAAIREVAEETGATAVTGFIKPDFPWQNASPSFVVTWGNVYYLRVDLEQIEKMKPDHGEVIYNAEYITVKELRERVRKGINKDTGAICRGATTLASLFMFFCEFPEFWE